MDRFVTSILENISRYIVHIMKAKFTKEELVEVSNILEIPATESRGAIGEHWWPNRGLGPIPPQDPVIYRLYEVLVVFDH